MPFLLPEGAFSPESNERRHKEAQVSRRQQELYVIRLPIDMRFEFLRLGSGRCGKQSSVFRQYVTAALGRHCSDAVPRSEKLTYSILPLAAFSSLFLQQSTTQNGMNGGIFRDSTSDAVSRWGRSSESQDQNLKDLIMIKNLLNTYTVRQRTRGFLNALGIS
jgi:hypothetical protein